MEDFYIIGGNKLFGEIEIDSAKNALLPILASCILIDGEVKIKSVPRYSDVIAMTEIIVHLGGSIKWENNDLLIDGRNINSSSISSVLSSKVRSSIFSLGPILGRMGKAKIAYPGGCDIGLRPIDIHLNGLRKFGCKVIEKNGYIYADASRKKSCDFVLPFPSVGATENLMMFALSCAGRTRIFNCAREPEIVDLQNFLKACGASINGAGGDIIYIDGGKKLYGCEYKPIPDRIETGTFLIACAMCQGKIQIKNALERHNKELISKLNKSTCKITCNNDNIIIENFSRPHTFGLIETAVYPGFPTDLQPQMIAYASICEGHSIVVENLFESRFKHVGELVKMGCDIKCKNGMCVIDGQENIYGAEVCSTDLRGGAALVLAGLVAQGYTTVHNIHLIDRGYYHLEDKLSCLGANIKRIESEKKVDNCN